MPSRARQPLPPHVVVASFRFRPNPDDIHGGQDTFTHGLVRALRQRGVSVDVLTFRGRNDPEEAIVHGARVHLLETPFSRAFTAHEAHQAGTWQLLEVMSAYSDAVENTLPRLRALKGGQSLTCLSQDVAEARWVRRARALGHRIITFAHVLFSEFALEDLDLTEFERIQRSAKFALPIRTIARAILSRPDAAKQVERIAKLVLRGQLWSILPRPVRSVLEGEHAAFGLAHHVLFPSSAMEEKVAARYPRMDRVEAHHVAPWAVDLDPASGESVRALEKELGIRSDDRVLVTMSRLSPDKRIDALLSALALIDARTPELASKLSVLVCGRPTFLDDVEYARSLEERASSLRNVRVRFCGYQRGEARTAHLLLAAKGRGRLVQVGRYEAFGLGIVEAMSLGIPVITSDTDGSRAILDRDRCPEADQAATLVRPERQESFEAALARAIESSFDPSTALSCAAARATANRHTWQGTLDALAFALAAPRSAANARASRSKTVANVREVGPGISRGLAARGATM